MWVIFGWGRTTSDDMGEALPVHCANCNNDVFWRLTHSRTWFTLFLIPVFPYESDYWLLCPICSRGKSLHTADEIARAKELVTATTSFRTRALSEAAYMQHVFAAGLA